MSKKNKYYTPAIEEFHFGFEYYYNAKYDSALKCTNGKWRKVKYLGRGDILTGYTELKNIKDLIFKEQVRVKHLDREDIEGFGFEYERKNDYGGDTYLLRVSNMINHDTLYTLDLTQSRLEIKTKHEGGMDDRWHTLFNGVAKNRSELARILTQIEVS